MQEAVLKQTALRAAILAKALRETIAELRLIEPGDMIGYIRGHKWATVADLVQSSSELSLRDGTLIFACRADFQVDWTMPPSISLDLEFQNDGVTVFFTLNLGRSRTSIEIGSVWFDTDPYDEETGTHRLAKAVTDARISPRNPGSWW